MTAAIGAIGRGMARTGQTVESGVEVRTVTLALEALDAGARCIMLDDMTVADIEQVVKLRAVRAHASRILLEASGTIRLDTGRAIAETGVDLISVGALTRSAPALGLAMGHKKFLTASCPYLDHPQRPVTVRLRRAPR